MAHQYREDVAEIRQKLIEAAAPLSKDKLAGSDIELIRFAFTAGLTQARTPAERHAPTSTLVTRASTTLPQGSGLNKCLCGMHVLVPIANKLQLLGTEATIRWKASLRQ